MKRRPILPNTNATADDLPETAEMTVDVDDDGEATRCSSTVHTVSNKEPGAATDDGGGHHTNQSIGVSFPLTLQTPEYPTRGI